MDTFPDELLARILALATESTSQTKEDRPNKHFNAESITASTYFEGLNTDPIEDDQKQSGAAQSCFKALYRLSRVCKRFSGLAPKINNVAVWDIATILEHPVVLKRFLEGAGGLIKGFAFTDECYSSVSLADTTGSVGTPSFAVRCLQQCPLLELFALRCSEGHALWQSATLLGKALSQSSKLKKVILDLPVECIRQHSTEGGTCQIQSESLLSLTINLRGVEGSLHLVIDAPLLVHLDVRRVLSLTGSTPSLKVMNLEDALSRSCTAVGQQQISSLLAGRSVRVLKISDHKQCSLIAEGQVRYLQDISPAGFLWLVEQCPHLEYLDTGSIGYYCLKNMDLDFWTALTDKCPSLTTWKMTNDVWLGTGIKKAVSRDIRLGGSGFRKLTTIEVDMRTRGLIDTSPENCCKIIGQLAPQLLELRLIGYCGVYFKQEWVQELHRSNARVRVYLQNSDGDTITSIHRPTI